MVSQITSLTIVYSTVFFRRRSKKTSKLRLTGIGEGNSPVTGEWGTTYVYFGITYVCFIPSRLPVFVVEPQYQHRDLSFLLKVSFEGHIQILKKDHVDLKFEWGS